MSPIRHIAAFTIVLFASGGPALAQSAASSPPPVSSTAPEPAPVPALSIATPIEVLVATPQSKAVLDADIPGLTTHPMYDQFKRENLRVLAPKFGNAITDKDLAKVQADLAALSLGTTSR